MTPFRERLERVADQATADITLANPAHVTDSPEQIASVTQLEALPKGDGLELEQSSPTPDTPTAPVFSLAAERSRRRSGFLVLAAAAAVAVLTMGAAAIVTNLDTADQATASLGVDAPGERDLALPGGRVEVEPHVVEWFVNDEATLIVQHGYTGVERAGPTRHPEVTVMVNGELFALESGPPADSDGTEGEFVFSPSLRPGINEVQITALFDSGEMVRLNEVVEIAE